MVKYENIKMWVDEFKILGQTNCKTSLLKNAICEYLDKHGYHYDVYQSEYGTYIIDNYDEV